LIWGGGREIAALLCVGKRVLKRGLGVKRRWIEDDAGVSCDPAAAIAGSSHRV
jgi:hypothetical protein